MRSWFLEVPIRERGISHKAKTWASNFHNDESETADGPEVPAG